MNIPCDIPCITCDPPPPGASGLGLAPNDPSNPFVNLSSEAPDIDLFLGRNYGGRLPPIGSTWYAVGCLGFCLSTESQDDADVCAANHSVFCQSVNWPVPNPVPGATPRLVPRDMFSNSVQFCSFTCPDGNLFTFTVAAGFFVAFSVAAANALAYSYACNKARLNRICFGEMNNRRTCLSGEMSSNVSVSSVNLPITFDIVSGALPPGTFPTQSSPTTFVISGNPTMAGDYPIRLRATDRFGNFMEKDFSVSVFGITDDAELPDATSGSEYTHQLNYAGTPAGAVVFSLVGGAFPDGVTMDSSGLISGTPTVDGAFQVTIRISDGVKTCDKTFDLFSENSGIDWSQIQWGAPQIFEILGGSASGSAAGNTVQMSISAPNVAPDSSFAQIQWDQNLGTTGPIVYSGPGQNCNARLTVSGESVDPIPGVFAVIWIGPDWLTHDSDILSLVNPGTGDGVYDFPFSVPSGPVNIWVTAFGGAGTSATDPSRSGTYNIEITNVP